MKPLPKFIAVAAIVGLVVVGGKFAFSLLPKSEPAVEAKPAAVVSVPAESSPAGQAAIAATPPVQAPAPAQGAPAPVLTPAAPVDAGLANVLGNKK